MRRRVAGLGASAFFAVVRRAGFFFSVAAGSSAAGSSTAGAAAPLAAASTAAAAASSGDGGPAGATGLRRVRFGVAATGAASGSASATLRRRPRAGLASAVSAASTVSTVSTASSSSSTPSTAVASSASAASGDTPSATPFFLRRRVPRRPLPFGKLRSSSRASAAGLRDIRVRAPLTTSPASAVCGMAAASSAALSRRSCWRAACTSRRALRACAPPLEFTSRPSSRFVSGQRCTAYSSCTSRVMFAQRQIQLFAWSRRPIFFSASACSTTFTPSRLSSRGQDSTKSSARSNASASRDAAISCSARSRSWAFLLRSTAVIRNVRLSSPFWSKWSIARARRQPAGATRAPASAAHWTCSP